MTMYGKYSVLSCRCIFASCGSSQCYILHDFQYLMLVGDARDDHMEEEYSRAGLITVL